MKHPNLDIVPSRMAPWWFFATLAALTIELRLMPTLRIVPYNLVPVGAFAFYMGARWRGWLSYAVPLGVMVLSNSILMFAMKDDMYAPWHPSQPIVYGCYALMVYIGHCLRKSENPLVLGAGALLGSMAFFVITNFFYWLLDPTSVHAMTPSGLIECYVAAIPFLHGSLAGDLIFSAAFFGLHTWIVNVQERAALEPALAETSH